MSSPINSSTVNHDNKILPLSEVTKSGALESRRVINTTESVNEILKQCEKVELENASASRKKMLGIAIQIAGAAALAIGVMAFAFFLAEGLLAIGSIAVSLSAGVITNLSTSAISAEALAIATFGGLGAGIPMIAIGCKLFETSEKMNKFLKENSSKKNLARDENFLDWAEADQIKLTYSNISDWNKHRLQAEILRNLDKQRELMIG